MEPGIHVELAAERLGTFLGVPITNTLLMSWVVMGVLIVLAYFIGRRPNLIPTKLQLIVESIIETVHDFAKETLDNDIVARRYLPLLLTLFLFIATSNILEFIPGVESIGLWHGTTFVPLLRSVNTDLNVTLALTIIVVFVIEFAGIVALGFWRYAGKFFTIRGHGIGERIVNCVVGLIELVSELSRFVSFSFRLFGNIFAGQILLAVAAFFLPYIVPSGLMAFELFIGVIQAVVFALLTLFFIKLAITDAHAAEH